MSNDFTATKAYRIDIENIVVLITAVMEFTFKSRRGPSVHSTTRSPTVTATRTGLRALYRRFYASSSCSKIQKT